MAEKDIHTKAKVLRCPNCGASDAVFDIDAGGLRCTHCREVFMSPKINQLGGMDELVGEIRESGAKDLRDDDYVVTFRCPSCGANVVLEKTATEAKCHWCHHNLSTAETKRILAKGGFWRKLKVENIRGVYLPYIMVDVRAKVKASGHAGVPGHPSESMKKMGLGKIDMMKISREFEMHIDDLTVEASRDRLQKDLLVNTNHIINSIMPFDTEEAVAWDPRYVKGYSCEGRDVNVENVKMRLDAQIHDIVKERMPSVTPEYGELSRTSVEEIKYLGRKWRTAYLPVWLYSYPGIRIGRKKIIHYIAVNARTGETMGSVPIRRWFSKFIISIPIIMIAAIVFFADKIKMSESQIAGWVITSMLLEMALIYFMNARTEEYTNVDARHEYELDTHVEVKKVKQLDELQNDYIPRIYKTKIIDEDGLERDYVPMQVEHKEEFRQK